MGEKNAVTKISETPGSWPGNNSMLGSGQPLLQGKEKTMLIKI